MKRFFFSLALASLVAGAAPQLAAAALDPDAITLSVPANIQIGQQIVGTLSGVPAGSAIGWYRDGALIGTGPDLSTEKLGVLGRTETIIEAVIKKDSGTVTKQFAVEPPLVRLAWQSDSYVPPFYAGKALFPAEGAITFFALTDFTDQSGARIPASGLSFTWKRDGVILGSRSGAGSDSYSESGTILARPFTIEVSVAPVGGGAAGIATASVAPASPQILIYKDNPLSGLELAAALPGSITLSDPELTLFAAPYFMSNSSFANLAFAWSQNGAPIGGAGQILTVRSPSGSTGKTLLTLSISNPDTILQNAGTSLSLSYTAPAPASPFNPI